MDLQPEQKEKYEFGKSSVYLDLLYCFTNKLKVVLNIYDYFIEGEITALQHSSTKRVKWIAIRRIHVNEDSETKIIQWFNINAVDSIIFEEKE